jgi:hypothetical protein
VEHLVDISPLGCSCEWSGDFRKEDEQKTWCVHIRRVRLWLEQNPAIPKSGKETLEALRIGRSAEIPTRRVKAFLEWVYRKDAAIAARCRITAKGKVTLIAP